ncbi:MAG: hypothetical protein ACOYOF_06650 [Verrucomicrobiaceae bacterium]
MLLYFLIPTLTLYLDYIILYNRDVWPVACIPGALPADLFSQSTSRSPDQGSIKTRTKFAIAKATAGLPQKQPAPLAFSLASTAVPGPRLLKIRHWSIH